MATLTRPVGALRWGREPDREADERIAALFNEGKSISVIARAEGVSWQSIQRRLKRIEREAAEAEGEV